MLSAYHHVASEYVEEKTSTTTTKRGRHQTAAAARYTADVYRLNLFVSTKASAAKG